MGRASRRKPLRLAKKLLHIRKSLELSQNEIIKRMSLRDELLREEISDFERGKRVPPLPILLEYAHIAGVYLDVLVDDELELPEMLPAKPKSEGIRRKKSSRVKKD